MPAPHVNLPLRKEDRIKTRARQSFVSNENARFGIKRPETPHTNTMFRIQEHENAHMVHDNQRKLEGLHGNTWTTSESSQHPKMSTDKDKGQREGQIPSL